MGNEEVSIKEYFDQQIAWLDRHVHAQLNLINQATDKAHAELNRRLEGMNEFRDSLKDQASRFATREEVMLHVKTLEGKIADLQKRDNQNVGRDRVITAITAVVISAAVSAVANFVFS